MSVAGGPVSPLTPATLLIWPRAPGVFRYQKRFICVAHFTQENLSRAAGSKGLGGGGGGGGAFI